MLGPSIGHGFLQHALLLPVAQHCQCVCISLCLWLSDIALALQMLARMKQDMGSTPKVSEAPQDEPLLPQPAPGQPGQPGHARKPSLGADATPRGGHARRKSLVSGIDTRLCNTHDIYLPVAQTG